MSDSTLPPPPPVGSLKPSGVPIACIRKPDSQVSGRSRWTYCGREPDYTEFTFDAAAWFQTVSGYRKGSSRALEACEVCCQRVIEDKAGSPVPAATYAGNQGR